LIALARPGQLGVHVALRLFPLKRRFSLDMPFLSARVPRRGDHFSGIDVLAALLFS
jgi:hypothetical protein